MAIITQNINGQDHYVRSPLETVTCNGIEYTVSVSLNLDPYTVGGNVDSAAATATFEEWERNRVNEAISCAYTLPHYEGDVLVYSLEQQCPFLTAV